MSLGRQAGPSADLKEVHGVEGTRRRDSTQLEGQIGRSKIGSAAGCRPERKSRSLTVDSCAAVLLSQERCGRIGRGRVEQPGVP